MPAVDAQAPIEITHLGSSIWSYRRRMIGAILIDTRPDRISMSAWRGELLVTSAPKRDRSVRGPASVVIISMAQHARPKPSGQAAFARAQFWAFSRLVITTRSST